MNDKIKIKNELSEKEFTILFSFEFDNHNYITYTDYEKDENGNILCFSSIYDNDKLIGYGRIIGDKTIFLYIRFHLFLSNFQKKKAVYEMLRRLLFLLLLFYFLFFIYQNRQS